MWANIKGAVKSKQVGDDFNGNFRNTWHKCVRQFAYSFGDIIRNKNAFETFFLLICYQT